MKLVLACLAGWMAVCALVMAQSSDETLPANPHAFLEQQDACAGCHKYWRGELEPHMFAVALDVKCRECHPPVGRQHPVNVAPSDSDHSIEVPDELPLAYIEELGQDVVSCGSCHNPHGEWLSTVRAHKNQAEHFLLIAGPNREIPYYKTYFLRISDPESGFLPLCTACHRDY